MFLYLFALYSKVLFWLNRSIQSIHTLKIKTEPIIFWFSNQFINFFFLDLVVLIFFFSV